MRDSFAKISSFSFDVKSPLSLSFKMSHEETFLDFKWMTKVPHANFGVKTKRLRGTVTHQGASADKINHALKLLSYADFVAYFFLNVEMSNVPFRKYPPSQQFRM